MAKHVGIIAFLSLLSAASVFADGPGQFVFGPARFTVITPECIRLEYQKDGHFIDDPSLFAVNRDRRYEDAKITRSSNTLQIDTGRIRLQYAPDGRDFHEGNLRAYIQNEQGSVEWHPGMENHGNLGGTAQRLDHIQGPVPVDPGLLSRDGWFLLDDSTKPILVDDGHGTTEDQRWVAARPAGSGKDWYLFGYGADFTAGLRAMTAIGGSVPMPRRYLLGTWYSRWWSYTSNDFRQIVQEFHDHDFPLDMMVMDMAWHIPGWTGLSWNRKLLPDAEALMKELADDGLHVTVNDHPAGGMSPKEDMYADFMRAMGQDPATHQTISYDAGNRKYLDTLFEYGQSARERDGVDFWWMDWWGDRKKFDKLDWLNEYYFRHSRENGKRGQTFSRWGGWGDHRHAIGFSGDVISNWWVLGYEVPFTAMAGNMGAFYWSHDIGGFQAPGLFNLGQIQGKVSGELIARWTQFGAVSPILRLHSTESATFDKRPWKWGPVVEESMRRSFHLRAELLPYIYSTAWEAHRDSMPLIRPLYLMHGSEPEAFANPQEYEFGDAFIAAPINHESGTPGLVSTQGVWFPPTKGGASYFNWFTGERYNTGNALVSADINELPLFARGGVPIVNQPYTERPGIAKIPELVIRAYPGPSGEVSSSTLYEDDGVSSEFEHGANALTTITYQRAGDIVGIEIAPTVGRFDGQLPSRAYMIELRETEKPSGAWLNGAVTSYAYDADHRVTRVRVPAQSITQGFVVTVSAPDADPSVAASEALSRRLSETTGEASSDPVGYLAKYVAGFHGELTGTARVLFGLAGIGVADRAGGIEVFGGGNSSHTPSHVKILGVLEGAQQDLLQGDCGSSACGFVPRSTHNGLITQAYVDFGRFWLEQDLAPRTE